MLEFLVQLQGSIRSAFSGNIEAFAANHDWLALLAVLPLGIVFGAAHALTPGHGKSVLAAYAVGSDLSRLKVMLTAVALAVTHISMAVLLAVVTNTIVTRTIVGAGQAPALELISRVLLVGVGLWLVLRALLGRPHTHGEGVMAGIAAGLVPCPLTLFLMFFATSQGVPEAGLTFAVAMVLGVGIVLTGVAVASVWARQHVVRLLEGRGMALPMVIRVVDVLAGVALLVLAAGQILP
ncbi:MAG: putative rane protein [Devosia sp.]|uniref:HoxN/HupN/NixA family nickel/cobalt transporter n=1 Tax=Devosia sp. TaxID=1871048 RepID=UPI00260FA6AB|nr:sulfite exporter TauE/SafE family protein [Devosia sp.]MDB5538896.1 putative rane protein [Devosia sp.]